MRRKLLSVFVVVAAFLALSGVAKADPIGPVCDSCNGATYSLMWLGDPSSDTLQVYLTIDTSLPGFELPGSWIAQVGFKVSTDLASVDVDSAPGGSGNWNPQLNQGINANGCSAGGNGFVCVDSTFPVATGGVLEWVFTVTNNSAGAFFLGPDEASIKTRYVNGSGQKVGALVSEPITFQEVPEPATLGLLGTGLLGVGALVRRKRRQA